MYTYLHTPHTAGKQYVNICSEFSMKSFAE